MTRIKDFSYDSGERQTALTFDAVRRDHSERYRFAAEDLMAWEREGPLQGLDCFCGNGYGTAYLAETLGARMRGVDGSTAAVEVARTRFAVPGSAYEVRVFPFDLPTSAFDFVTCFESIEHVEEDDLLLARLAGALRIGGRLYLSAPSEMELPLAANASWFRHHVRHYEDWKVLRSAATLGLRALAKSGQSPYRLDGNRVVEILPESEHGMRRGLRGAQFLVYAFEKVDAQAARAERGGLRSLLVRMLGGSS